MDLEYCPCCMSPVKLGEPCGICKLPAGSYTPAEHHLPPGTVLRGRYLVDRVLGEGTTAITYIGRDSVLGRKAAVREYFTGCCARRGADGVDPLRLPDSLNSRQYAALTHALAIYPKERTQTMAQFRQELFLPPPPGPYQAIERTHDPAI